MKLMKVDTAKTKSSLRSLKTAPEPTNAIHGSLDLAMPAAPLLQTFEEATQRILFFFVLPRLKFVA